MATAPAATIPPREHRDERYEPPGESDAPTTTLEPRRRQRLEERQRAVVVDVVAAQLAVVERHDLDAATGRWTPPCLAFRARGEPGRRRRRRGWAQVGRVAADD